MKVVVATADTFFLVHVVFEWKQLVVGKQLCVLLLTKYFVKRVKTAFVIRLSIVAIGY